MVMTRSGSAAPKEHGSSLPVLAGVTIVTGIVAGLGGMGLALLLHAIQHIAFGYDMYQPHGAESFLQGVSDAAPFRRVVVLGVCGLVAGLGWWSVRRFCRPLVSISQAVEAHDDHRMPVVATICHALLQIVTVALGSPLGREVAPRELAAVCAGKIAQFAHLTSQESRVLVASAAGAGLAAVYNVPVGGMLFTLEVLLGTFRFSAVLPAMATSGIASMIAWIGLGDATQYHFSQQTISVSLVAWSLVMGPLLGMAAFAFSRGAAAARRHAPQDWRMIVLCLVHFVLLGTLAIPYPELLGNGRGPIQLSFYDALSPNLAAVLFLLKFFFVIASLRVGAAGGLLTPSLALGAMLATMSAGLWNLALPPIEPASLAIIGAGAFLASSLNMPVTALVLAFEFTHFAHDFFYPLLFAVAGSYATYTLLARRGVRIG
ncbi:chloride channel protein [Desulfovibrio sp. DV]|uniref:chloride channel protein n=1 Tax=Desulfovibrio sp. DV TaxID=1844708 RepID=UPI000AF77965|nr:chloride channel protein [Desulfovibrio sp. DV]